MAAPIKLKLAKDTGSSKTDTVTSNGQITISGGKATSTLSARWSNDGGLTWSDWSATGKTLAPPATDGTWSVQVRELSPTGALVSNAFLGFVLDTTATAPVVQLAQDTGFSATDGISQVGTLAVTGTETGAKVQYSLNNGATWVNTFVAKTGANTVWVRQTDKAGNVSTATRFDFSVDKTAAAAPTVALVEDSGTAGDTLAANGNLNIGMEAGARAQYSTDGGVSWSDSFTAAEGLNTVRVRQVDAAGNASTGTAFSFTLDSTGPSAGEDAASTAVDTPVTVDVLANDSDASAFSLTGATAGAHGSVVVNADSTLTYTPEAGWSGSDSFSYTVLDAAGNTSTATVLIDVVGDIVPPPTGTNTAPEDFGPLSIWTPMDQPVSIWALQNAWDADGDALSVTGLPAVLPAGVSFDAETQTFAFDPTLLTGDTTVTVNYGITDGLATLATAITFSAGNAAFDPLDPASVDAATLTDALVGPGTGMAVDVESVVWHASGSSATNRYNGSLTALGIGAGLLLTSGTTPSPFNTSTGFGSDNNDWNANPDGNNGDADLDAVVNTVFATQSYDATTLEFDFAVTDPTATSISFDLVFGSDEYPEWVDAFVDVAVVLVNGVNVALFNHDPLAPLSVIGGNLAASYFMNNTDGHLPIEYDGVSARLKIVAPVTAGTNHIKIGIGDTGDHILDSGIFLANFAAGNLPGGGVLIDQDDEEGSEGDDLIDLSDRSSDCLAHGRGGDDVLIGGSGDDTLVGGRGEDLLRGNGGSDVFDYRAFDDWADREQDTIDDFSGNTAVLADAASLAGLTGDVLLVDWALLAAQNDFVGTGFTAPSAGHFSTLSAAWLSARTDGVADAAHAQFVYDAATGLVGFDPDGTDSASAIDLTLIGTTPAALTLTDIVIAG